MKAAKRWVSLAGAAGAVLLLAVLGGCANPSGGARVDVYQGATKLTGASYDFGPVNTFSSTTTTTFTITNTGSATITLSGINLGGTDSADFKFPLVIVGDVAGPPVVVSPTIAPGQSYTFNLYFAPSKVGAESATVTVTTDQGTATFNLNGTGTASGTFSLSYSTDGGTTYPFTINSGDTLSAFATLVGGGSSPIVLFQITETSGANLYLGKVTVTNTPGMDFEVTSQAGFSVAPQGSLLFAMRADYLSPGNTTYVETVTIPSSSTNGTQQNFKFKVSDVQQ